MSALSQIGYSGLRAAQISMTATGQNVANVNTPGYSRLDPVLTSLVGQGTSAGGGVDVNSIRRFSSDFLNQQLWHATSSQNYNNTKQQYLTPLEGLMGSDGANISKGLDQFFAGVSAASSSAMPDSIALRQQVISTAGNLAQRFNGLSDSINDQITAVHGQRQEMVVSINDLAGSIAKLNKQISQTQSGGGDVSTLSDHRENLVKQLSTLTNVRVNAVSDGTLTVSFANGQPLVAGDSAAQLKLSTSSGDSSLQLNFAGTNFPLDQHGIGGGLGGLYDVENGQLAPQLSALHDMASQFAQKVNSTLASGFDLGGNPGKPLFAYDPNNSSGMLNVTNIAPQALAFSDTVGEAGNNQAALKLLDIKSQTVTVNGSPQTLNDAYAGMLGAVGSDSQQNQADLSSTTTVTQQAQAQRDSTSAVNLDEEAVSLMSYQQAYQANMKVIQTANTLFDSMLAAF